MMFISRNFSLTPMSCDKLFSALQILYKRLKIHILLFSPRPFLKKIFGLVFLFLFVSTFFSIFNLTIEQYIIFFPFFFNLLLLLMPFSFWRSFLSRYSSTVASLAVLWPKEIMCCSWRWVVAAPNPKDFGLFLAQEVLMMQPKMEMSSHLREPEVSREQHPLCLPGEGKYYLFFIVSCIVVALSFLLVWLWHSVEGNQNVFKYFTNMTSM